MELLGEKLSNWGNLEIEQRKGISGVGVISNYTITRYPNYSLRLAGACQFTGWMLPLTISVIFLSINNLGLNSDCSTGSAA